MFNKEDYIMINAMKTKINTSKKLRAIYAFTLAEVLLVIAIIGAVSILSVNNAVKNTTSAEKIVQLKKTYDILQGAIMAGIGEAGDSIKWGAYGSGSSSAAFSSSIIQKIIIPHLKVQKDCSTSAGCWKSTIKNNISNDPVEIDSDNAWYKFILANGASVAMTITFLDGDTPIDDDSMLLLGGDYPDDQQVGVVYVDVDGPNKGPGKAGDDVFAFVLLDKNGLYPHGNNITIAAKSSGTTTTCPELGEYCTAWALYKGNEDYFKCPNELSWSDSTKSHCQVK